MGGIYDIDMKTWYFEKKRAQLARIFSSLLIFQVFKFARELQHGKELVSHLLNPARHLAAVKIPRGGGERVKQLARGLHVQNPFRKMITKGWTGTKHCHTIFKRKIPFSIKIFLWQPPTDKATFYSFLFCTFIYDEHNSSHYRWLAKLSDQMETLSFIGNVYLFQT